MKLKKISLAEQAYLELAERIVDGRCPGGAPLTEQGVSGELGISRTPVREALRKLAAEGLVEERPGRGFAVSRPEPERIAELFECRSRIEPLALADGFDLLPRAELEALRDRLRNAAPGERKVVSLEVDESLHALIVAHCRNRCLAEIAGRLILRCAPFRALRNYGGRRDGCDPEEERLALLEAMLDGDVARSCELLAAHILHGPVRVEPFSGR